MVNVYYDADADLGLLNGKTIGIVGYGSQGHAHALNLDSSGVSVVVGLRKESPSRTKAEEAGLRVLTPEEAARQGDVVMLTLPDETAADIYREQVAPNLQSGNYLAVAHGFNIHFGAIRPAPGVNVFMVAPKGPGHTVRQHYEEGRGVPSLVAVNADPSGDSLQIALAYAKGIGAGRAGIIETTFREETETDLFGEQAVLCGGSEALIKAGFETLVEAGYPAELAYFEVLHELKLIVDLYYEGGLEYMNYSISDTAEYGNYSRGPRVIGAAVKQEMKKILGEIQSGAFAKEWIAECETGAVRFQELRSQSRQHPVEKVGKKLRQMMSWLRPKKEADTARSPVAV